MKLMASLAPARAEFEAGVVAKADQQKLVLQTSKNVKITLWLQNHKIKH